MSSSPVRRIAPRQRRRWITQIEEAERAAQAREAERQRQDAERQRQDAERQRQDAERQRQEIERQRQESERQRQEVERQRQEVERQLYETEREVQAHRRRNGVIAVGLGGALTVIGAIVGASLGNGASGGPDNTVDLIASTGVVVGLLGLIPYGTIKILSNPDLGPYKPTPTPTGSKGVAFTFSF